VWLMRVKATARVLEDYSTRGSNSESLWCGCHPTIDTVPGQNKPFAHDIPPAPTPLPVGFGTPISMFLYTVRVHTCISYCDIWLYLCFQNFESLRYQGYISSRLQYLAGVNHKSGRGIPKKERKKRKGKKPLDTRRRGRKS
jgi:hypothetical protein